MTLDVRELLRRIRSGEADRAVSRALKVARKTVSRYREWAAREGYLEGPLPPAGDLDSKLKEMVPKCPLPRQPFKAAEFHGQIDAWLKAGVSPRAMYDRLKEDGKFAGSYSSVYRYVKTLKVETPDGFVRIEVDPGEEAQVDFGSGGEQVDPETGEVKRSWVFVMTLSHSRHQYARLVFDQKVSTWLACHREAFDHFGGVPRKIVIDNLKAAIVKALFYDPVVQRSYREFAEHYGFLISPCRPRTAWHKGKVESGVKYVKRNFLAGRTFRDIVEANEKLLGWVMNVAGTRLHGTTRERPLARFEAAERAALLPLPHSPYDMGIWKQATLHPDCHVVVDYAYYSAPHRLIGEALWVRTNGRDVVIFHDYERIATHRWGSPGTRRTNPDHYPPEKAAFLMKTPQYCQKQAASIGPATVEMVNRLLGERPLDRLRTVQAILRLAEKHTAPRLEAAARRALAFDDIALRTVKRILDEGLEALPLPGAELDLFPRSFTFARPGSDIFPAQGGTDHGR
jgi:transposase